MGKRSVKTPIAFMPSDGRFLGAKDLQGLPASSTGERMPILITDIVGYDKGERVNGKAMPEFWALEFERPTNDWLLHDWPKPAIDRWIRSRKEWKIGPEVAGRIALRFGADTTSWAGRLLPIRLETTTFGKNSVYCVRPVPMPWESDRRKVEAAMRAIAAGTWVPCEDEPPLDNEPEFTSNRSQGTRAPR